MLELYRPVGIKEAALDSPSFRASTLHFVEQVDLVERWLEGCIKLILKLSHELSSLESLIGNILGNTIPPALLSEAILDHDYSLLAAKRYGDNAKEFWSTSISCMKKMEGNIVDPLRNFLQVDLRNFREIRRQLDHHQRQFDALQSRYSSQPRTKEPSALREDAFQLHEARKAYLKASLDFSSATPQLRMGLDKLLVRVFSDQSQAMQIAKDGRSILFSKWSPELNRIKGWSREIETGEKAFRRELQLARKQIEEAVEVAARPSRELEDYSPSSASSNIVKGPSNTLSSTNQRYPKFEKQGWLNLKIIIGKPARTEKWVRRWFFVKNCVFGWLIQGSRSGGVEESERIGVLLCGVRLASHEERRFTFEIKTKKFSHLLQADTHSDLNEWMSTFELAKQKALEDPSGTDRSSSGVLSALQEFDPAFAISSPRALEFAASAADIGFTPDDSLPFPLTGDSSGMAHRASFDVSSGRRSTTFEGESNRDQGTRLMQKLDIHRKTTTGLSNALAAPATGSTAPFSSAGGIASLISSSHLTLPLGPGPLPQTLSTDGSYCTPFSNSRSTLSYAMRAASASTLAPATLANPPNPSNLSATAVLVSSEKDVGFGQAETTPSGLLANSWGSSNWGFINRLERGEVISGKSLNHGATIGNISYLKAHLKSSPSALVGDDAPTSVIGQTEGEIAEQQHRKTVSLDGDTAEFQRAMINPQTFPHYYPSLLKHQDAQFRLLFHNATMEDKLVLVFRATWNPNDQQEFPGRVYVTPREIFFYSNHLGLVLTTGLALNRIVEVTAAPGRDCDFLFLHLRETDHVDYTRITIKTFLEPLRLLQRRLNFLVQNSVSDNPQSLESVLKIMTRLEVNGDDLERSPSLESWDEALNVDNQSSKNTTKDLRTHVFIDQGLSALGRQAERESIRFKLPSRPVEYIPMGMSVPVFEKEFSISPKALFHVMFGDRSAVFRELLLHERQAENIKQGPWIQEEKNHMHRTFQYNIEYTDILGRTSRVDVIDSQTIDVLSQHLCYVITDRKKAFHLPLHEQYMLVSKIVITHVAKSRCKLSIYTKVDWSKQPFLAGSVIERRALSDLKLDALDLGDVISEQVRRLGSSYRTSHTKKALHIFGAVGQETQVTEFGGGRRNPSLQIKRPTRKRTLIHLSLEAFGSLLEDIITSIVMWAIAGVKWCWRVASINWLVLFFLCISVMSNAIILSQQSFAWWQDHRASEYMNNLGIGQGLFMEKVISVYDFELANSFIAKDSEADIDVW